MINTGIDSVKTQKYFYRDYYRKAIDILVALLFCELLLVGAIMYVFLDRSVPSFYASSSSGQLALLKALPQPNRSATPLIA